MERISQVPGFEVWLVELTRPFVFDSPFDGRDFAMMLLVNDTSITREEQDALCRAMVRQGCRFAAVAGHECERWHDAIDWACLAPTGKFDRDYEPPDDRFVMTTWHERERLREVVFTLFACSGFDDWVPEQFVIVFLGRNDAAERRIIQAVDAELHDEIKYPAKMLIREIREDIQRRGATGSGQRGDGDRAAERIPLARKGVRNRFKSRLLAPFVSFFRRWTSGRRR